MVTEIPLDELSQAFARVNGMLLSEETVDHAVELLAQAAKTTVPGAIGAGVTVISASGDKQSAGSTDRVVREADVLQYETGQGPCLTAWGSQKIINVGDVGSDRRWPQWTAAVGELPIRSVVSAPMLHRETAVGVLKVYSAGRDAFTDETQRLVTMFAGPAVALLAHVQTKDLPVQLSESVQRAMASRDTINIGKGVLMAEQGLDHDQATRQMLQYARTEGVTLLAAAEVVIASRPRQIGPAR